jgi:[protein-PII] uridylyltransferase
MVTEVQKFLERRRSEILKAHLDRASGKEIVSALTAVADEAIGRLYLDAIVRSRAASPSWSGEDLVLVALGGYGRQELAPYSDIDIMFLYREDGSETARDVAAIILRGLWDLGYRIGHSQRTIRDCVTIGRSDLTVKTSLMEARFLVGSRSLYREFHKRYQEEVVYKNVSAYIARKIEERAQEYERYGSTLYLLEPDIKMSKGGLRDLHLLKWAALARYQTFSLADLYQRALLSQKDFQILMEAQEFLWRIRNELHFHAGRCYDVLSFDEQVRLAEVFQFEDQLKRLAVESFMQRYYQHTTGLHHVSIRFLNRVQPRSFWQRLGDRFSSRVVEQDFLMTRETISVLPGAQAEVLRRPERLLRLFYLSQQHGVRISDELLETVHEQVELMPAELFQSPETGRLFLAILSGTSPNGRQQGGHVAETVTAMHQVHLLGKLLPSFSAVRGLMQFNEYHKYTVDEHCIRSVQEAEAMIGQGSYLERIYREIHRKDLLHLALLLHDLGKGESGDHSVIGKRIALESANRLGLTEHERDLLALLVERHLLMSHLAFRRDLNDQKVLLRFAREVATPEALKMLLILTAADIAAVGPGVRTPWKEDLLLELYLKGVEELTGSRPLVSEQKRLADIRAAVTRQLGEHYPEDWLAQQWKASNARYLLTTPPEKIAMHLQWIHDLSPAEVRLAVHHQPDSGLTEITVFTFDTLIPGIFSKIAGVMAAKGLQILGAQIHTRADQVVVDTFQVLDPDYEGPPPEERWEDIGETIQAVLKGRITVESLLTQKRRISISRGVTLVREPTRVEVDNDTSDQFTILDVFAQDKRGLLSIITKAIYELGLSVHSSKIATRLDQIVDVFYVTNHTGEKVTEENRIQEIRRRLTSDIEAFLTVESN